MAASQFKRKSCPTEKRLIIREHLKYYNALVVAGIYSFSDQPGHLDNPAFYFPALRKCIDTHSMLTAIVRNEITPDESYDIVDSIDLNNHVNILQISSDPQHHSIATIIEHIHNNPDLAIFNQRNIPPWRIDIVPLESQQQIFISFTYSHRIGDGMSGSFFHQTFIEALMENLKPVPAHIKIKHSDLPVLPHLPVSLGFLLAPALGHYLPTFLSRLLGVKASASGSDDETWIGSTFFHISVYPIRTAVEIFEIDRETLKAVLESCRRHQTTLTPLLNELIALSMSRRMIKYCSCFSEKKNLISCIPTNLRKAAGVPDVIGNIASATYSKHPVTNNESWEDIWSRARIQGTHLALSVKSLKNQPVGLLAWISDMKAWMEEKIGQQRDSSWQLSNLMSFDGGDTIQQMFFSQPADVVGIPLNFNTISLKGGDLVICVSWQIGAMGLDDGMNERILVRELFEDLKRYLQCITEND